MTQYLSIFLTFTLFSLTGLAQDERYYRQILSGDLPKNVAQLQGPSKEAQFVVTGPTYSLDLDGDKIEESLEAQKRDGVDWIEIKNSSKVKIFEAKLLAMGSRSNLYKIKLVQISKDVKALILFLDEGFTSGKKFESTGRIFVLSFVGNDLRTLRLAQGPHFFHEKEAQNSQYWRRQYSVNVYDIDGDGVREIAIQYNHIQRIMKYGTGGEWERF